MADKTYAEKLDALRSQMQAQSIDGYFIPRVDEWQGEYVPACAERLSYICGFTGSAGMALISTNAALAISDGRYEEQLPLQVDTALFDLRIAAMNGSGFAEELAEWISAHYEQKHFVIGYDPRLHTVSEVERLCKSFGKHDISMKAVSGNLVDLTWDNRPDHPDDPVFDFPYTIAGSTAKEKREDIARNLEHDALLLTQPDSIAWLLNVRGNDVPHTPIVLSYGVLHKNGTFDWFVPVEKISKDMQFILGNDVRIHDLATLEDKLGEIAADVQSIQIDGDSAPIYFTEIFKGKYTLHNDPCIAKKACKTKTEKQSILQTHIADGVAIVRLLKYLDEEAGSNTLDELLVEKKLAEYRSMHPDYADDSFAPIVGWADHGAIIHYRATEKSNAEIKSSGLLLLDSGGQYFSKKMAGTTDITRTIAIGEATDEMKEMFTRVLKGHIAIARTKFPAGTIGQEIDILARQSLRNIDKDFKHGTGHGVGCYLSVHEDGTGIHRMAKTAFQPGMLISNEPGYYKTGEYGIRIENLIMVEEAGKNNTTGIMMLKFYTVSLAPIDARLVDASLLSQGELKWLNNYHKVVYDTLRTELDSNEQKWLKDATKPIKASLKP